jgi:hypothetical protein
MSRGIPGSARCVKEAWVLHKLVATATMLKTKLKELSVREFPETVTDELSVSEKAKAVPRCTAKF